MFIRTIRCAGLAVVTALLLTACASPQQRAAYAEQQRYQAEQARNAHFEGLTARCQQYGFQTGTTAFAQCLQQAEQQEIVNNAIRWQQDQQQRQQVQDAFKPLIDFDKNTREQFKNIK